MRIEVQSRTTQPGIDNRATVGERCRRLLDRFERRIARLEVQIRDLNGPKGGVDREVQVRAALDGGEVLVTRARAELIPRAIDSALRKLARRVRDLSGRQQRVRQPAAMI